MADRLSNADRELITEYIDVAGLIAHRISLKNTLRYITKEDLDSEAKIALCLAVTKYDPNRGASFRTFVYYFITWHLQRYLRDNDVRGRPAREGSAALSRAADRLHSELGRPATNEEICTRAGLTSKQAYKALQITALVATILSLDGHILDMDTDVDNYYDIVSDNSLRDWEDTVVSNLLLDEVLDDRERETLVLHLSGMTQERQAAMEGTTQMMISRRLTKIRAKLRRHYGAED